MSSKRRAVCLLLSTSHSPNVKNIPKLRIKTTEKLHIADRMDSIFPAFFQFGTQRTVISPFNHNKQSFAPRDRAIGLLMLPTGTIDDRCLPARIRLSLGSKYLPLIDSFCLFFLRSVASSGCNVTLERPPRAHSEHAI